MKKFAESVIRFRALIILVLFIITAYWGIQIRHLTIFTDFEGLLPQTHPYIKVHKKFKETFGGANLMVMLLEVREGDIFNKKTLEKIKYISEELEKIPGIDRYKILSIAQKKMKSFKVTSWGLSSAPLMWPYPPNTAEEMETLKNAIWSNPRYYGTFVSYDNKKSLIMADFLAEALDYSVVYEMLNKIRATVEDDKHSLYIVGNPMHLGTVRNMVSRINYIMLGTVLVIPILLFFAYRSVWATILVPSAGIISAIWGLGFMAVMGYNLDPLVLVMPFLISLMAFRHSHQLYNRFYEEYMKHNDKTKCAQTVIEEMFIPGLTSVVTDAFGIAVVAIVPIPVLQNISIACAFWSIITVFIGLLLTPILLCYVPISHSFMEHINKERLKDEEHRGFANQFADWLGPWLLRQGRYVVLGVVLIVVVFSYYWSEKLIVGDATVGSNLLYPSSRYNQDSERINKTHPIINPLYIVVYGQKYDAIKSMQVLADIDGFSRYMQKKSGAVGCQNIVQPLLGLNQGMHGNYPKWYGFPDNDNETIVYFISLTTTGDPGDMDKFIDYHDQFTNIAIFYKDKTGPTIKRALSTAKEYIDKYSNLSGTDTKYLMAGGVIGVEAAINEVVTEKQLETLIYALLGVLLFCSIEFKSIKAGLILTIPLLISNFMAFAYMAINNIGLSISTLPVSAAGIGMGVDYGIYLLARMSENKKNNPSFNLNEVVISAIQSYGKSIIYIAGTLIVGLLVWTISPLKFQAQMGMMLAVILFLNCLGAVFLVPVLVLLFKPKFLIDKG